MRKKLLATLLVLVMVASIVPLAASAEECAQHDFVPAADYWGAEAARDYHVCTICHVQEAHIDDDCDCVCDICGQQLDHTDANLDCICDVCGGEDHDFVLLSDENGHWYGCSNCGQKADYGSYEAHTDTQARVYTRVWEYFITSWVWMPYVESENVADGVCDVCGYGCNHTKTAIATGDEGSIEYCVSCGTILTTTTTCTEHTFTSDGEDTHTCTTCGYSEDHIDADEDCICDACGEDCHGTWSTSYDEDFHYLTCSKCGEIFARYPHTDEDSDGKCDSCGYEMSSTATNPEPSTDPTTGNTTTTDQNLDDVPQTGDSSLILVGIALLIVAVPVVKKFVF